MFALAFLRPVGAFAGAVLGWVFGDWRRILALLVLAGFVAIYIVAYSQGHRAGEAGKTAALQAQAKAFVAAADKAATEEHNRQMAAAKAAQADFDKQMKARDMADTAKSAALEKEIASYEAQLAKAGHSCPITPDDLKHLGVLNAKP